MTLLGIAGAHRTGKSTLAKAFAERHEMQFLETSVSKVFKDMGLDPSKRYDFATRMTVQERVLDVMDELYGSLKLTGEAITDRTPIDMIAYTMADIGPGGITEEEGARFEAYVARCIEVVNRRFSMIVVLQPGIKLVAKEGTGFMNQAYIEHLNTIIRGLIADERITIYTPHMERALIDPEHRLLGMDAAYNRMLRRGNEAVHAHVQAGGMIH